MAVTAIVSSRIRIRESDLPSDVIDEIRESLKFKNEAREAAAREHRHGWKDMPESIDFWAEEAGTLVLPRGYALTLKRGLDKKNIKIEWDDRRTAPEMSRETIRQMTPAPLWQLQVPAVEGILRVTQGILQAPPGAGKTVAAYEAIRRAERRALVMVNTSEIAEQWIERCEQHLSYSPGIVGDGRWEEKDITIAMVPTLWSRRATLLEQDWFKRWGFAVWDECHHVPATTWMTLAQDMPARYRMGTSGTPGKSPSKLKIARAVLGEIYHVVPKEELRKAGILIKPRVEVVRTDFDFPFVRTTAVKADQDPCPVEDGCKRVGKRHVHKNNYSKLLSNLIIDGVRNHLIADEIVKRCRGQHGLVLSNRKKHLTTLRELVISRGWDEHAALMLTGDQTATQRTEVIREIERRHESVTFSTIADEALDVPRLSRLFMAFPTRDPLLVEQRVGRIERAHPEKTDALVIDFVDGNVKVLSGQWTTRRNQAYRPAGLDVHDPMLIPTAQNVFGETSGS